MDAGGAAISFITTPLNPPVTFQPGKYPRHRRKMGPRAVSQFSRCLWAVLMQRVKYYEIRASDVEPSTDHTIAHRQCTAQPPQGQHGLLYHWKHS